MNALHSKGVLHLQGRFGEAWQLEAGRGKGKVIPLRDKACSQDVLRTQAVHACRRFSAFHSDDTYGCMCGAA